MGNKVMVDLNADLGEGFGLYTAGPDAELMNYITSANVACGFHAGDFMVMARTVELAKEKGVQVGAHPSLPDLQGFGRRDMKVTPEEVRNMVIYQIGALQAFLTKAGMSLQHVKPHGALYNMAARDTKLALAIAEAVKAVAPSAVLVGLAKSEMIKAAHAVGLAAAQEVFADRSYNADGTLVPRHIPGAVVTDTEQVIERTLYLVTQRKVVAINGTEIDMDADTICLHGDNPEALILASELRRALTQSGIVVAPLCMVLTAKSKLGE